MVSIFRSEDVEFCHLVLPTESAYEVIQAFGDLECVQFINLNTELATSSLKFTPNIFMCEELERKLRTLETIIATEKLPAAPLNPELSQVPLQRDFSAFEAEIDKITSEIVLSNSNLHDLLVGYNDLVQYRQVLRCAENASPIKSQSNSEIALSLGNLITILGIIEKSRIIKFEQFLWRACRGNFLLRRLSEDEVLRDPITGQSVKKCIFAIYIQGSQIEVKVRKICDVFSASVYNIPDDDNERSQIGLALMTRIRDFEIILTQSQESRRALLFTISQKLMSYKVKIFKIKAIFAVLNMFIFDPSGRSLRGECWCPRVFLDVVRHKLLEIGRSQQSEYGAFLETVKPPTTPPTYFRVNRLTAGFQNLVDSYAVATYKEVNPGLFMIITFPFLFSIMFGDFIHGLVIFIFGAYLVLREKFLMKYENQEMFGLLFSGRYIILLMGIFSLYSGIIYNEFLSKSLFIFSTGWKFPDGSTNPTLTQVASLAKSSTPQTVYLDPKVFSKNNPYPVGMDPLWMFGVNKITFINSFKMKISIIIGFFHMLFGILLSCVNHFYFLNKIDFIAEFVPQMLFFGCLFGYLVFLIFFKWITFTAFNSSPPSILLTFINMFFNFGKEIPKSDQFYDGQKYVQMILVVVSVICIPWLLCLKPLLLLIKKRGKPKNPVTIRSNLVSDPENSNTDETRLTEIRTQNITASNHTEHSEDESDKGMGEICIMQMIHTIEFCLGGVSNTASYLRLWALSLAHSQLSELLWGVFRKGLGATNFSGVIMIVLILPPFLILSLSILVVMEGLSTFLHAIRLHWVEFQNKFYKGAGKPLIVFSFRELVKTITVE